MQSTILAIGSKMPKWCNLACEEYLTRLQRFFKCNLIEIPTATRHKAGVVAQYKEEEGRKILQKISSQDHMIALDVQGRSLSTLELSEELAAWKLRGKDLYFVIGGPDGLSSECLARANQRWSLSELVFPHPLVRVILLEQLYRAASILANHPYHRE